MKNISTLLWMKGVGSIITEIGSMCNYATGGADTVNINLIMDRVDKLIDYKI